jgi:hypothetical protein
MVAVELSALHTSRALLPRNIIFLLLVLISVRGCSAAGTQLCVHVCARGLCIGHYEPSSS